MIHGISGKTGGGKSYEAVVSHIIPIITKDKRKVVTNLPLNIDHFVAIYGEYCRDLIEVIDGDFHNYGGERPFSKAEHYLQYEDWQNEKGQRVYFFIDEAHLPMPRGKTDKKTEEFYSMHRHYGFDIVLITQNFRKVSIDIKDLVGNHYRAIKKSMMGQDDRYILKVHDGAVSSNASVVATHERFYEKKYFKFYQSHTKSESSVEEATSNDIEKWYKHWTIKLSIVFFLFAFFLLSTILSSGESSSESIENSTQAKELTAAANDNVNSEAVLSDSSSVKDNLALDKPITDEVIKRTPRQVEFEEMVGLSSTFHPFYKVDLSISGYAEYLDLDRRTRTHYFSASQNGQHVFTIKTGDLLMAGYSVQILSECTAKIRYYDYVDFITCNAPVQSVQSSGDALASN
jgi:zona occludens toxin